MVYCTKINLITAYIFRDAKVKYSSSGSKTSSTETNKMHSVDGENTLELICSIGKEYATKDIFYIGFQQAVERCTKILSLENILIEETGTNINIIDKITQYNTSYFMKSPTSFFLYNYACYSIAAKNCLLLY